MSDYQIWNFDDFGANHVISNQCQSHDCRDALLQLKEANPNFKVTLFAIPGEMTPELLRWSYLSRDWVKLAMHGFYHYSNYECEKLDNGDFTAMIGEFMDVLDDYFVKGFKAPGWQISDGVYTWLSHHGWWVADQAYNDNRRPKELPVYKVGENSVHGHTWDCMGNGIYETLPQLLEKVKETKEFRFISEVVNET